MLCQNCQTAIQAAVTETGNNPERVCFTVAHAFHHTFFDSLLQGCLICRHMWRQIREQVRPSDSGPSPFDEDQVYEHILVLGNLLQMRRYRYTKRILRPSTTPGPPLSRLLLVAMMRLILKSVARQLLERNMESVIPVLQHWERTPRFINFSKAHPQSINGVWERTPAFLSCWACHFPHKDCYYVMISGENNHTRTRLMTEEMFYLLPVVHPRDCMSGISGNTVYQISPSTSAGSELWCDWLRVCSETHDECNRLHPSIGFIPERLVEIYPDRDGTPFKWRLIQSKNQTAFGSYVTLSHCWGRTIHMRLTQATLSSLLSENTTSELPKTYQDAMKIAVSLGFRRIWVDSLCIIQDDEEDWKRQSAVMGLIYKHASCNVAATWAKDGTQGCFSSRDPALIAPTTVTLKVDPELRTSREFCITRAHAYDHDLEGAPLNQRGWVLQERYMARRQLNFMKDEVYWECPQLIASEQFPNGVPRPLWETSRESSMSAKPRINYDDECDLRRAWSRLVQSYTSMQLTVYTDKMIAIAGLASELRDRFNDQYLAGMWRKSLHKQLCWRVRHPRSTARYSRASLYLAPTWSWVSSESSIFDYSYDEAYPTAYLVEILKTSVESQHPSGLHSFISGTLELRGIAMWARVYKARDRKRLWQSKEFVASTNHIRSAAFADVTGTDITIFWDEEFGEEELDLRERVQEVRRSELLLIWVSVVDDLRLSEFRAYPAQGLVLAPERSGEFVRVGVFWQDQKESHWLLGMIKTRVGLEPDISLVENLDLSDPRLADLVQTVIIR